MRVGEGGVEVVEEKDVFGWMVGWLFGWLFGWLVGWWDEEEIDNHSCK